MMPCVEQEGKARSNDGLHKPLSLSLAEAVARNGVAQAAVPAGELSRYASALTAAKSFFDLPSTAKMSVSAGNGCGWRAEGAEYSVTPQRPDLNESFVVWTHSAGEPPPSAVPEAAALHHALSELMLPLLGIAQTLLGRMASMNAPAGEAGRSIDVAGATYIQVNRYRPAIFPGRDFLQERHEDGHLVTLQYSAADGLEIEAPDGRWLCVPGGSDRITVLSGEILTMLSGGATPTVHHRVRRLPDQDERFAIMLFVTQTLAGRLQPWRPASDPAVKRVLHACGHDVNKHIWKDQRRFGMDDASMLFKAR